jgi:cobalt-zinc-cadmium resistance protein CzcA
VVRLPRSLREQRFDDLKRLPVRVDDGGLLTLGQVADFGGRAGQRHRARIQPAPRRHHGEPARPRRGELRLEAQKKVAAANQAADGYTIEFGGQFKNLQEARARLAIVVPVALASSSS